MRWMLRSKIHRATVTDANLDYVGSITIDEDLMDLSGILAGEKVTVAVVDNGNRLETYVIPGPRGKGDICLNGAAAHLAKKDMKVIVMGYELADGPVEQHIVFVDGNNRPVDKSQLVDDPPFVPKVKTPSPGRVVLRCYSDGGSRGNPGLSAYGIVITRDGRTVFEHGECLGTHTNNYAEYRGLIAAMKKAIELGADEAEFIMDSQLVIKQMTGVYRVNNPDMAALNKEAREISTLIPKVSFRNVRRSQELIPRADELVNSAMDSFSKR